MTRFDVTMWRKEHEELVANIRDLKVVRRKRDPQRPDWTWREAAALKAAKAAATQLYIVRAHARGRVHHAPAWDERRETVLAELFPKYQKEEMTQAA